MKTTYIDGAPALVALTPAQQRAAHDLARTTLRVQLTLLACAAFLAVAATVLIG